MLRNLLRWLLPIGLLRLSFDGGGGGSSSSSSNSTTTTNIDKRLAISSGVGVSSDSSTVTVNALDHDAIAKAFDAIAANDAAAGQGFESLIGLAGKLFDGGFHALDRSQQLTADAYSTATVDKAGGLDNKTIAILGIAATMAAAWVMRK